MFGDKKPSWNEKTKIWFKNYGSKAVLPVIAALILATGIFLYYQLQPQTSENTAGNQSPAQQEETTSLPESENEIITAPLAQNNQSKNEVTSQPAPKEQTTQDANSITTVAQAGEGATHLARRALKTYLAENPEISLNKEQKIYVEDYLKDQAEKKILDVGDSLSFDKDLINQAVSQATSLTTQQLQSLEKYSALVPSL